MSNQSNPPQTGRSAKESRTSAKHALLNLFPHKIRFEDITAEGIDEEILKDLYEEVGIKITSQSSRRVPVGDTGQGSASEIALIPNGTINDITPGPERRQAPSRSPLRPDQETNSARSEPNNQLNHSSITSEATNHQRPIIGGPTPKTHSVTTDQVSVTPTEPHLSASMGKGASPQLLPPTPASPPLERKDKIARLLAAKNVKNLSTPTTQKPTSAAHVDAGASKQSQYGATPRGGGVVPDEGTSPDGFVDIDSFSEAPPQVSNNSLRATHAKKRVEVESVRQRVMPSQIETVPQVPQQRSSIRPFTTTSGKLGIRQSSDAETPLEAIKHTVLDDTRSEQPFTEHTTSVRHSKTTIPQGIQVNHTSFSGIPGLFLTSPATAASVSHSHPTTVVEKSTSSEEVVNRRKRPVASDFDPGPISSTGSWKRPFGRSRTDQLIIEVSDDELVDEGGDSGTEFDYGTHQPSAQAQIAQSSQNTTSIRDMPPLTDLTSRRPFSAGNSNGPVSALNTPPVLQKSTSIKESDSLKSKEASIEEMRRKIAAMEQRARAKGSTSRAQTPATPGRASAVAGLASPLVVSSKAIEPSKEHDLSTAEPLQQPKARSTEVAGNTNAEQKAERPAKEAESAVVAIASTAAKSKAEEIAEVRAAALEKLRIAQQEKAKNLALEKEKALEQEKAKAAAFEQHKAAEQERSRLVAAEEQRVQKLERARLEALENQKVKEEEQAKAEAAEKQKAEESEKARAVALEKEKKAQELERARAAVVQRRKVAELEKARIAAVEKQKAADAEKARATEIEKRKLEELKKAQIAALAKQKAEEEDRAKAEAAEQKRQRRAAIESDLPLLDAQVAKQKERLEQLRREMQEAEQKIQRDMKGRRDLVEELESLGVATEGRSTAALQAQKAEILEQRKTGTERIPGKSSPHYCPESQLLAPRCGQE